MIPLLFWKPVPKKLKAKTWKLVKKWIKENKKSS